MRADGLEKLRKVWYNHNEVNVMAISELDKQMKSLCSGHFIADLANASALLMQSMDRLNWAGFYLTEGQTLVLGPFQGKVACIEIPFGRGVCGTAAAKNETQRVPNVHEFPGHIACDGASDSEIVIPIRQNGRVVGVLDMDSPVFDRFSAEDQAALEAFVRVLEETLPFPG